MVCTPAKPCACLVPMWRTASANRRRLRGSRGSVLTRSPDAAVPPEWKRFLLQFHAPLVYILLAAAGITAWLGEWIDSSVIFGVVFINAIIGYIQESKAEHAIEALSRLVLTETTVRRDGQRRRIPSRATRARRRRADPIG